MRLKCLARWVLLCVVQMCSVRAGRRCNDIGENDARAQCARVKPDMFQIQGVRVLEGWDGGRSLRIKLERPNVLFGVQHFPNRRTRPRQNAARPQQFGFRSSRYFQQPPLQDYSDPEAYQQTPTVVPGGAERIRRPRPLPQYVGLQPRLLIPGQVRPLPNAPTERGPGSEGGEGQQRPLIPGDGEQPRLPGGISHEQKSRLTSLVQGRGAGNEQQHQGGDGPAYEVEQGGEHEEGSPQPEGQQRPGLPPRGPGGRGGPRPGPGVPVGPGGPGPGRPGPGRPGPVPVAPTGVRPPTGGPSGSANESTPARINSNDLRTAASGFPKPLKAAVVGKYYYPPRSPLPLPTCFHNPTGYVCCNLELNDLIENTYADLSKEKGFNKCNIGLIALRVQKASEKRFGTPFESITALEDFAQKITFSNDLVCKLEIDGKYLLAYATAFDAQAAIDPEEAENAAKEAEAERLRAAEELLKKQEEEEDKKKGARDE